MSWRCECGNNNADPWGCAACGRPAPDEVTATALEQGSPSGVARVGQRALSVAAAVLLVAGLVGVIVEQPARLSRLAVGPGAVPAAANRTVAKSFQMQLAFRTEGLKTGSLSGNLSVTSVGSFDPVARRGYFTGRTSGSMVPGALQDFRQQIVITPDAVYQTTPTPLDGKHWIKSPVATGTGSWASGLGNDPSQALSSLQRNSSDIQRAGTDTIRGALTAHYRLKLNQTIGGRSLSVPAEAWIDTEGRLRRLQFVEDLTQVLPAGVPGNISAGTLHASVDLFGFGVAVPDRTPPANDIVGSPSSE